jgi:hypothetical protein
MVRWPHMLLAALLTSARAPAISARGPNMAIMLPPDSHSVPDCKSSQATEDDKSC